MLFPLLPAAPPLAPNEVVLSLDAREAPRGIFHVNERVPVRGERLSLYYPKWIPGEHGPSGPLNSVIRFEVRAGGKQLSWRRDPVDLFRIDVAVPKGTSEVEVSFDDVAGEEEFGNMATVNLARIKWNRLIWYPRGRSKDVTVRSDIRVPEGWSVATALDSDRKEGSRTYFDPVGLERFIDSPAQIGRYFKTYDVTGRSSTPHFLDVMAESPEAIAPKPETLAAFAGLHEEMEAVTGTRHYRKYRWLLTLSDEGAEEGLEHHESSEDGEPEAALTDPLVTLDLGDLMAHEYFHSYNGKFRRPAGLATPEFETPMRDELLWVYEGLTQYYGEILAARSGFWTPEVYRDRLAQTVDVLRATTGRKWRPLVDTADAASILYEGSGWGYGQRGVDFYSEMTLVWLEAESILRARSGGKRGMDDFLRTFHGGQNRGPEVRSYAYRDVVRTLNGIASYDWDGFFQTRVYGLQPEPTVAGIEAAGWRLVYNETPNASNLSAEAAWGSKPIPFGIGFRLGGDSVSRVIPGSPADLAGLVPGVKITSVNGKAFTVDVLFAAIMAKKPLEFAGEYKGAKGTYRVDYTGGLVYPHLEPIPGKPDLLTPLCAPRR